MVLVGLGSNRGDTVGFVRRAADELARLYPRDFRASSLWRTSPVDCPPGSGDFVNAVVSFDVDAGNPAGDPAGDPEQLLARLKAMEKCYGRGVARVKNAPREIDLDLLVFGSEVRTVPGLTLPHPRAHLRRFVMVPAAEVAPGLVWPGTRRSIAQLAGALETEEVLTRIGRLRS